MYYNFQDRPFSRGRGKMSLHKADVPKAESSPLRSFHYAWVIVAIGFLIIFACIGLARYACTMLLPSMQAGLVLSYDRLRPARKTVP
jgi:hypothetical protein